jgi:subtilisin family serine protease
MDNYGLSFLNQSSSSFMDGNPAYSHGTLCAGIIAVIAPDSMIMPLRVFDDKGQADLFTIAKAIRYAVDQGGARRQYELWNVSEFCGDQEIDRLRH